MSRPDTPHRAVRKIGLSPAEIANRRMTPEQKRLALLREESWAHCSMARFYAGLAANSVGATRRRFAAEAAHFTERARKCALLGARSTEEPWRDSAPSGSDEPASRSQERTAA